MFTCCRQKSITAILWKTHHSIPIIMSVTVEMYSMTRNVGYIIFSPILKHHASACLSRGKVIILDLGIRCKLMVSFIIDSPQNSLDRKIIGIHCWSGHRPKRNFFVLAGNQTSVILPQFVTVTFLSLCPVTEFDSLMPLIPQLMTGNHPEHIHST